MCELVKLGWTEDFARHFVQTAGLLPARVVAEHRGGYRVRTVHDEYQAHVSGRLRHQANGPADFPAVGDWVIVQTTAPELVGGNNSRAALARPSPQQGDKRRHGLQLTIREVLPRKSKFSRKVPGDQTQEQVVAANIDVVWIVSALDRDFSLRRIERYLALAWESGARPVIVLTKSDLSDQPTRYAEQVEAVCRDVPIHVTSSLTRDGVSDLQQYFRQHATVALLGSSGVGKSTLINVAADDELQATAAVRSDGKGRHTTTHRQLLRLPQGGLVIDTPGMRELQLWDGETGLATAFADIDEFAAECRFSDCLHVGEPGCAVKQAISRGELATDRLASFHKLQRELAYLERKQDARAQSEEKRRIKSLMKSVRHHPKYKR